jgi:L,D-peptidoglycan transpeptidase YkuD (ErfK/YbiS/YcfS/YnhG family)
LLLLLTPLVASATTATTTISSTISPVISLLSSNGTVNLNATPATGGVQTIASDTVTVSTNDSAGYTLTLGETTSATALTSGGNTIAASSGSQASPVAETASSWGYRVDSLGGFGAGPTSAASNQAISSTKFAAIPASGSPNTLVTTSSTASGATTTVWYGLAVNTSVPSGTYSNSVTYTATAN